jgi:hypothetical protein
VIKVKFIENVVLYEADGTPRYGFQEGEIKELADDVAHRWLRRNKCEVYDGAAEEGALVAQTEPATLDDVMGAIELVDRDDASLWTHTGMPQVKALETVLGNRKVTKELRDLAWVKLQSK